MASSSAWSDSIDMACSPVGANIYSLYLHVLILLVCNPVKLAFDQ